MVLAKSSKSKSNLVHKQGKVKYLCQVSSERRKSDWNGGDFQLHPH